MLVLILNENNVLCSTKRSLYEKIILVILALDESNNAGGLLGRNVEIEDSEAMPNVLLATAEKLALNEAVRRRNHRLEHQ
ncbi:hypothetical protein QF028_004113 [Neobacillus sp. B4I6]|uniref:hypothetical protein n=1 Tax=Neobacillus sp. B4I6 TaxID=3373925 RepID=UPI003D1ED5A2